MGNPKLLMWQGEDIVCTLVKAKGAQFAPDRGSALKLCKKITTNQSELLRSSWFGVLLLFGIEEKSIESTSEKQFFVYMHTNKANGKKYIGITCQEPKKRWLSGHGYSDKLRFGRAVKKYGWANFEHTIIYAGLSAEEAKQEEIRLISYYQTTDPNFGYNLTAGGDGLNGYHITEESRKKMSDAKKGPNHPNYGKHLSPETRAKIGRKHIGNKYCAGLIRSEETRRKMSESKEKPVYMCDDDGNIVERFASAKKAELSTGISRKNISLCCLKQRKHAGGYAWMFA